MEKDLNKVVRIDFEQLKADIQKEIENQIENIFLKFQDRLYIMDGEIDPLELLKLDKIQEDLTEAIYAVLLFEMKKS